MEATGVIELEQDSFVKDEKDKKKRFMFSVGTSRRVFFIVADNEKDMLSWIESIKRNIEGNAPTPGGQMCRYVILTRLVDSSANFV